MARKRVNDLVVARRWLRGEKSADIAAEFGVTREGLYAVARRLDLPLRRTNGQLRLTGSGAMAYHLKGLLALGVGPREIASAFGVSQAEVRAEAARQGLAAGSEALRRAPPPDAAGARPDAPPPACSGVRHWTRDRDARLRDVPAPPSYRALARLAEDWGLPLREVQARWHRVRAGA